MLIVTPLHYKVLVCPQHHSNQQTNSISHTKSAWDLPDTQKENLMHSIPDKSSLEVYILLPITNKIHD